MEFQKAYTCRTFFHQEALQLIRNSTDRQEDYTELEKRYKAFYKLIKSDGGRLGWKTAAVVNAITSFFENAYWTAKDHPYLR